VGIQLLLDAFGSVAHFTEEAFLSGLWATWTPTLIAFIVCLFLIGIALMPICFPSSVRERFFSSFFDTKSVTLSYL